MKVPAPVEQLHEPHSLLHQAAGQQAVVRKGRLPRLRAVLLKRGLRFAADIHHLRHADLHAVRQLILVDARQRLGVADLAVLLLVKFPERVEASAAHGAAHAFRVRHVQDRIAGAAALHALKDRRQIPAPPKALASRRIGVTGDQHHETRQIRVLRAKPVSDPRPHRRRAVAGRTGVKQHLCWRVIELIGVHRLHEREVIRQTGQRRIHVADPLAVLPVLLERVRRAQQFGMPLDERQPPALDELLRARLVVQLVQLRLVVEQVQLRRRTGHVQVNDVFDLARQRRQMRCHRVGGARSRPAHQRAKRQRAEPHLAPPQEMAPSDELCLLEIDAHLKTRFTVSLSSGWRQGLTTHLPRPLGLPFPAGWPRPVRAPFYQKVPSRHLAPSGTRPARR